MSDVHLLRFKDGRGITHAVLTRTESRAVGGFDAEMRCGLRYNLLPRHFRRRAAVDCMACMAERIRWES